MRRGHLAAVCVISAGAVFTCVTTAFAYLVPGAGLTAIGAFLALIVGMIVAFFGFIWYPVKRLLRKRKIGGVSPNEPKQNPQAESANEGL
jgi:hypothetical protein